MRKSLSRSLGFALLAVALTAAVAAGQTQSGTVEGNIVDGTGQVLPGVSVTLTGEGGTESLFGAAHPVAWSAFTLYGDWR